MDLMAQEKGPFHAVIAHSFGMLITSYALVNRNFPPPARLVYFCAFNRLLDSLPRFQVSSDLPDEDMDGFCMLLYEEFGRDVLESITNETLTPQTTLHRLRIVMQSRESGETHTWLRLRD